MRARLGGTREALTGLQNLAAHHRTEQGDQAVKWVAPVEKLYGRGTCDMKGDLACCLAMVPDLKARKLMLPFDHRRCRRGA